VINQAGSGTEADSQPGHREGDKSNRKEQHVKSDVYFHGY
jgi:hypothetical protein